MSAAPPKPVVLCILDGWGLREETEANAVALANTPSFDRLRAEGPFSTLKACGEAVGLPEGQMGNSEVGHTNIGAGRIVWMDLPRIDRAIADGSFTKNPALTGFVTRVKTAGGTAHLAGLVSPGGVHSHQRHIAAAAREIAKAGVPVKIHAWLDGRDTPPKSAVGYLEALAAELPEGVEIATICGRFHAMDRDNRWDRVAGATALLLRGEGETAATPREVATRHILEESFADYRTVDGLTLPHQWRVRFITENRGQQVGLFSAGNRDLTVVEWLSVFDSLSQNVAIDPKTFVLY